MSMTSYLVTVATEMSVSAELLQFATNFWGGEALGTEGTNISLRDETTLPAATSQTKQTVSVEGDQRAESKVLPYHNHPVSLKDSQRDGLWLPAILSVAQQEIRTTPSHCGTTV